MSPETDLNSLAARVRTSSFSERSYKRDIPTLVDTNVLLKRSAHAWVQGGIRRRNPLYITDGIKAEVLRMRQIARSRYTKAHGRLRQRRSGELAKTQGAANLVKAIESVGNMFNVWTAQRDYADEVGEFEISRVLAPLVRCTPKSAIIRLLEEEGDRVYDIFSTLINCVERCQEVSNGPDRTYNDVVELVVNGFAPYGFFSFTQSTEILEELEELNTALIASLSGEMRARIAYLNSSDFPGKIGSVAKIHQGLEKTLQSFFRGNLVHILNAIGSSGNSFDAMHKYGQARKETDLTDLSLVFASYGELAAIYPQRDVVLLTDDNELCDVLRLRRATTVEYPAF